MVSILLDKHVLLQEMFAHAPDTLQIALRGADGLGAKGDFFFGNPQILAPNPVKLKSRLQR